VVVGAGLAAYADSFRGAFRLDDLHRIVDNPQIRHLWPPWQVMAGTSRPLVELSLAVNYALGGLDVWGYHAFNLTVHLLAGLTLFGLVRLMLQGPRLRPRYGHAAPWLAMAVALLWLLHPLQTESVTYIIQRAESLMGLFYLLTLYCGIRGSRSPHPRPWFIAAVGACALGMGSKEVMVSAPLVMLLYDRVFLSDSFTEIFRRRWGFYLGLGANWLLLGALVATNRVEEQTVLVAGLTPLRYAMAQFGVIVHYLSLSLWPHPLVLDYAWRPPETPGSVVPWAAVVTALVGGTVLAFRRVPWVGFWGAWFFLILAPTSSLLPIADLAFEHRMYLSLAAVVVLVVIGLHEALGLVLHRLAAPGQLRWRLEVGLLVAAVAVLASITVRRNEDYRSDLAIWSDTAARRPDNPRAHYNLGHALYQRRNINDAIAHFSEAVRLKPDYVEAHHNLGHALVAQGQIKEGIAHYSEALRLNPNYVLAHYNLGVALAKQGETNEAITQYSETIRLKPDFAPAHNNLAVALIGQGQIKEATIHFEEAIRLKPDFAEAHRNLGSALLLQGQVKDAIPHLEKALRLKPNFREALNDLRAAEASLQNTKDKP